MTANRTPVCAPGVGSARRDGCDEGSRYDESRAAIRPARHRLTAYGVVTHDGPDRFALGPVGSILTSTDGTGGRDAILLTEQLWWPLFGALSDAIASGRAGAEHVYGTNVFEWLGAHPEELVQFTRAMNAIHHGESDAVADAYDFSGAHRVVDIGGGNGTGIAAVLRRYPDVEAVLFDLPPVIAQGGSALGDEAGRCELVGGDFFDAVPAGGDAYLLSHLIHDWDRDRALRILRNCRDAMAAGGRILIIESVVRHGDEPHPAKFLDMAMLAFTGGMERTEEEYRDLLAEAGLELTRVVPTPSAVSVVEAAAQARRRNRSHAEGSERRLRL